MWVKCVLVWYSHPLTSIFGLVNCRSRRWDFNFTSILHTLCCCHIYWLKLFLVWYELKSIFCAVSLYLVSKDGYVLWRILKLIVFLFLHELQYLQSTLWSFTQNPCPCKKWCWVNLFKTLPNSLIGVIATYIVGRKVSYWAIRIY